MKSNQPTFVLKLSSPIAIVIMALIALPAFAQDANTATATKGDIHLQINLPGIFVADDKDEIKMEPRKYKGDLVITKILAEGVNVNQGDVLMEFDKDEVDDAVEEAQNEATDADVELKKATAEYETAKIDLEATRAQRITELAHLEREVQATIAKQRIELAEKEKGISDAEYQLANRLIDYDTLKQMYDERDIQNPISADILFEREEKAIAKNQRKIDVLEKEIAYFKKFDKSKPQLEKELDVVKKRAEIKKENITLEAAVAEKNSVVAKAQRKMDAANKKVEGLQQDREQLQVISPRDGVLFYGATGKEMPAGIIVFGGGRGDIRKELRIGGRVKTHKVLLTVSKMDHLSIKMSVSEDDIQHLKHGLRITVYPDAFPSEQFAGELSKVDQIATKISFASSQRRFKVMGKCTDDAPKLRSGMNCRVSINSEPVKDVVLVPVASVFLVDGKYVCYVVNGDQVEPREVKIGLSNPELVEIRDGLEGGVKVRLSKPQCKPQFKPH